VSGFEGKVAVVTGGSAGIGAAIAAAFAGAGARVVSIDRQAPAAPVAGVRHLEGDVSEFEAVGRCVREIVEAEGAIDCLVNNAGISRDAPIWKLTEGQWDEVIAVDLKSAFNTIHHVAPRMREQGGGKIVNVSSINGLRGKFGLTNYSAAKAGLIGLTKSVAKELGRYNVNVNAVAPGFVNTALMSKLPQRFLDAARDETVLGRLGEPEEVASLVLFLCSEGARHVTGEIIKVDGGQYI
jgi:3-oxoacyl-[acyl-carrier protein] reductase